MPFMGRHRFAASPTPGVLTPLRSGSLLPSPPSFTHARRTQQPKVSCPIHRRQLIRFHSSPVQITPRCSQPNKLQKEAATAPEASGSGRCRSTFKWSFPAERPLAGLVYKIIAEAPAALGIHPGSSVFRRQPALASVLHFVRTWICYVRCLRFRLPPAKHSPSPIRITPLLFANPTNYKKKQPPHPKRRAAVAAVAAPPTVSPISPSSHQR